MSAQIIETEETLIIETPERVPLAFALASIGNRFLAVAIDHTIQDASIGLVALLFLFAAGQFDDGTHQISLSHAAALRAARYSRCFSVAQARQVRYFPEGLA